MFATCFTTVVVLLMVAVCTKLLQKFKALQDGAGEKLGVTVTVAVVVEQQISFSVAGLIL